MIRARFKTFFHDPRPVNWPIKHPYWVTGQGTNEHAFYHTLVAYADSHQEILDNWPEAEDIDSEEVEGYNFTSRFPKPEWFE